MEQLYRRQPRKRRRFQIRGQRSGKGQQVYALLYVFGKKAQRNPGLAHTDFVHLHLHTEYSLLDGDCRLDRLIDKAHELKFPALATTYHGVLYGAIDFYKAARSILSLPISLAPTNRQILDAFK